MNKVIAVFSPTGGIGVSTVAAHLAYQFADQSETALVDLNPDFGSIGQILQFSPKVDKYPIAMRADSAFLNQLSLPRQKRLKFFPSPPSTVPETTDWKNQLENCRRIFPFAVIDLPHTFLVQDLFIGLEQSDLIVLVCEYNWASILNARYFLDNSHEGISKKIKVIMNKADWLPQNVIQDCHKNLGCAPFAALLTDAGLERVHRLSSNSIFGKGIKSLADKLKLELKDADV